MKKCLLLMGFSILTTFAHADFLLWLDAPTRSNPNDPKFAGKSQQANFIPNPTSTVPAGSTNTPTNTLTNTPVNTATYTNSNTATAVVGTATPTYTLGPPTNTFTATDTSTPVPPTATPTPTATLCGSCGTTPTIGPTYIISDFEQPVVGINDNRDMPAFFADGRVQRNGYGGVMNPGYFNFNSATAPGSDATGPASGYAACFDGNVTSGFYHVDFCFTCKTGSGCTDVTSSIPAERIYFDFKSNSAATTYRLQAVQPCIAGMSGQGAWWEYSFTPVDTAWHQYVVYFPGAASGPQLTFPSWASTPYPWDPTQIQEFEIVVQAGGTTVNFDFCVDNVVFQ